MRIDAVRLRHFRGFGHETTLELKPLTVLLGPNSSGKSSFGHALAAMTHCQRLDPGAQKPTLTPRSLPDEWPIDLGTINDLRTHGQTGRVYVGLHTKAGWVELGFGGWDPEEIRLYLSHISYPFHPSVSTTPIPKGELTGIPPGEEQVAGSFENVTETKSPNALVAYREKDSAGIWLDANDKQQMTVDLDCLIPRSIQHLGGTFIALEREAQEALRSLFASLTYLRPSRERPSRSYGKTVGQWQPIGYTGEYTAAVLRKDAQTPVIVLRPPSIPDSLEDAKNSRDEPWERQEVTLAEGVNFWLEHLGLARTIGVVDDEGDKRPLHVKVCLPDQKPHDITEVGYGVSQILPVLTAGLLQPKDSLFVVDLPESHLHPRPQAQLADFFCSLASAGRCTLVETHSEMFFHRLRLRAEMSPELRDKTAVYFIDEPSGGECQQPTLVGLGSPGQQLRWPIGFFAEAWDAEKHIRIIREAQRSRS